MANPSDKAPPSPAPISRPTHSAGALLLLFVLGIHVSAAFAQPSDLFLATVVLDPSGLPVPGAVVTVRGPGPDRVQVASIAGEVRFDGLAPGRYRVGVEAPELAFEEVRVDLREGSVAGLELKLRLATLEQSVDVAPGAFSPSLSAADNRDAITINQNLLKNLPMLDLDVMASIARFLDPAGGATSIVVDGAEARNPGVTASAIEEIRINQNPYTSEYPRWSRRRIEIITKTAADAYHGSLSFLLRDSGLNARNAFAAIRAPEQRRLWEGSLFGPLGDGKRNSFLVSAQRQDENVQTAVFAEGPSGTIRGNVPTPTENSFVSLRISRQQTDSTKMFWQGNTQDRRRENVGVGGLSTAEVGASNRLREDEFAFNLSSALSPERLTQFRVLLGRYSSPTISNLAAPRREVSGAFVGGGAQADSLRTEVHTSIVWMMTETHGPHTLKYGFNVPDWSRRGLSDRAAQSGIYSYASLEDFAAGRAYALTIQQGEPRTIVIEKNVGGFVQDDWQVNQRLSLSLGLRYDWQNYFGDRDNLAPRLGLAFAPGSQRNWVIRAGGGLFYERSGPGPLWDVTRFDGERLRRLVVTDPLTIQSGDLSGEPTSIHRIAPGAELPLIAQFSAGAERPLGSRTTLAVNFVGIRGSHQFRSRDGNAPTPPDFEARPDSRWSVLRWIESPARIESNLLEATVRGALAPRIEGVAQYQFGKTRSDTGGLDSFPADSFSPAGEWGRADTDVRHRFNLAATAELHAWLNLGFFASLSSGPPFNITTGSDDNRDGLALDRPAGVVRNAGFAAGSAVIDLRWSKRFDLQPKEKEGAKLTFSLDAFNVLNRVNLTSFVGALSSPLFGQPSAAAPARQLQLGGRFEF